jgi:two-component system phosphate regulon response regulator PhoB
MPEPPAVDFRLLHERFAVQVGDREVVLTPSQFRLLAVMVKEPGRTFSRAELVQHAFEAPVDERTVDVHIKDLRRKLEPHAQRIETVRKRGYCYTAK